VEDSGASLAKPSQTLYLSGDPGSKPSKKEDIQAVAKQAMNAGKGD
jgi:hypothetical protein